VLVAGGINHIRAQAASGHERRVSGDAAGALQTFAGGKRSVDEHRLQVLEVGFGERRSSEQVDTQHSESVERVASSRSRRPVATFPPH
jgi:hypothetical protein